MSPERRQRVQEIFKQALEQDPAERDTFLTEVCTGDAELQQEVHSLLNSSTGAGPLEGRKFGPYRLVRELGRGGIDVVYLAERSGDPVKSPLAIRIIASSADDHQLLLRTEQPALAGLDHPNIARLLDAGTSNDGLVYQVTEYVEGQALEDYAASRSLTLTARLNLFLKICAAVHYGHQNHVIHGGLKPSSIVVTPDGEPHLIDFGIAQSSDLSGEPHTVAGDVYSLGVILQVLMRGQHPVESDLELIIRTATHQQPERRYGSVHDFSGAIRRYLEDLPVSAQKYTFGHYMRTQASRHKAGTAATVLAGAVLLAVAGASIWYAQQARREQARTERRLIDTGGLIGLLFELDDAVRSGSTAAREQAVTKTLDSLNHLLAEAGPDPVLKRHLVEGFLRVGDLQGNPYGPNLGDTAGALRSYTRAKDLASSLLANGEDPALRRNLLRAELKFADLSAVAGDRKRALELYKSALTEVEKSGGGDLQDLMMVLEKLAFTQSLAGDLGAAAQNYQRYLEAARHAYAGRPASAEARGAVATGESRLGEILARQGETDAGVEKMRSAWNTQTELLASDPNSAGLQRAVAATANGLGGALSETHPDEAIAVLRRGLSVSEALLRFDPDNLQYRRDFALTASSLASTLAQAGNRRDAMDLSRRALEEMDLVAGRPEATGSDHDNYARTLLNSPFPELRDTRKALLHAQQAVHISHGADSSALDTLASAQKAAGDCETAAGTWKLALKMLPQGNASFKSRVEMEAALHSVASCIPR